jgi:twitching motility two-component system response regulator PilG
MPIEHGHTHAPGFSAAPPAGAEPARAGGPLPATEPDGVEAWLHLARTAHAPDDALEYLRRARAVAPDDRRVAQAYENLLLREGISAAKAGVKDKARQLLREATALAPGDERGWLWRASVAQGYAEAVDCLNRVLAITPGHPVAQSALDRLRERLAARGAANAPAGTAAPSAPEPARSDSPTDGKARPPAPPNPAPQNPVAGDGRPVPPVRASGAVDGESPRVDGHAAARGTDAPVGPTTAPTGTPPGHHAPAPSVPLLHLVPGGLAPTQSEAPRPPLQAPAGPAAALEASAPPARPAPAAPAPRDPPEDARGGLETARRRGDVGNGTPSRSGNILQLFDRPQSGRPAVPDTAAKTLSALPDPAARTPAVVTDASANATPDARPPRAAVAAPVARDEPPRSVVLVVDDSPTVLKVVSYELTRHGLEVVTASDGPEALRTLETLSPDLVLLDINMPLMDGYQVCRAIRANDRTRRIPVVMLSGKDGFFDKIRGRLAGAAEYITKPFEPPALLAMLEKYFPVRLAGPPPAGGRHQG